MTTKLIHGSPVSYQAEHRTEVDSGYGLIYDGTVAVPITPVFLWPGLNTGFNIDVEETFEEIQHNPVHSEKDHLLEQIRNAKVGEELAFSINVHPQKEMHWPLLRFITGDAYGLGDQPDSSSWMKELDGKWSRFSGIMMEDVKVEIPGVGVVKESYTGFAGHRFAIDETTPGYTEAIEDLSRPIVWSDIQEMQMGAIGQGVWGLQTTPDVEKDWQGVVHGNGLYVAVADLGTLNRVMTSIDAVTWEFQTSPVGDNNWQDIAYGNGIYVAVANDTTGDRVMTSPDGKTWTLQTTPAGDQAWQSICFGNGLFVAVASDSISNTDRVMTSPDGVTWTLRTSVDKDNAWQSITHANDLFVAVSNTGTLDMVMTSIDAVTWTSRVTPAGNNAWQGVVHGNGLYVAVASTGTLDRVMTSPDGVTWTLRTTPVGDNNWQDIAYGNGLFIAIADTGTLDRVMSSPDGKVWTPLATPAGDNNWRGVICANGVYVAISETGTENRVMTSTSTVIDIEHCLSDITFGFTSEVVKVIDTPLVLSTGIEDVRVVSRKMFVTLKLGWINQTFIDVVSGTERLYLRMAIGASPDMTTFEFWGLKWPKYIAKAVPKEVIGDNITSIVDRPGFKYSTT